MDTESAEVVNQAWSGGMVAKPSLESTRELLSGC
jgi:hypothetical protein